MPARCSESASSCRAAAAAEGDDAAKVYYENAAALGNEDAKAAFKRSECS